MIRSGTMWICNERMHIEELSYSVKRSGALRKKEDCKVISGFGCVCERLASPPAKYYSVCTLRGAEVSRRPLNLNEWYRSRKAAGLRATAKCPGRRRWPRCRSSTAAAAAALAAASAEGEGPSRRGHSVCDAAAPRATRCPPPRLRLRLPASVTK